MILASFRGRLTSADHQTHQVFPFSVPDGCRRLTFRLEYSPRLLPPVEASVAARVALDGQRAAMVTTLPPPWPEPSKPDAEQAVLIGAWYAAYQARWNNPALGPVVVANLLALMLDDADGVYRGSAHRGAARHDLFIGRRQASPGLVPGPLPAGTWQFTLSAHAVATPTCDYGIQIGAEMATSRSSASNASA